MKNLIKELKNVINHNKKENELSSPLKISMNTTKKCNLRCKQCFTESGINMKDELNTKEIFNLFDQMRELGTFFICLGGGEPLTRPDLLDILEYGKNKQLAVSVVSNGLLLTKEYIEQLNTKNLDTPSCILYDELRLCKCLIMLYLTTEIFNFQCTS